MRRLLALGWCTLSGTAHAQLTDVEWQPEAREAPDAQRAAEPEPERRREEPYRALLGATIGTGAVWNATERAGWAARIEYEALYVPHPPRPGPIIGARWGLEGWKASGEGGGSLPTSAFLGFGTPGFVAALGFGLHALLYDYRDARGGFGLYAPFGVASVGVRAGGFAVSADLRASYRWQWSAPDYRQTIAGVAVSWLLPVIGEPRGATSRSACDRDAPADSAGAPCGQPDTRPPPSP